MSDLSDTQEATFLLLYGLLMFLTGMGAACWLAAINKLQQQITADRRAAQRAYREAIEESHPVELKPTWKTDAEQIAEYNEQVNRDQQMPFDPQEAAEVAEMFGDPDEPEPEIRHG